MRITSSGAMQLNSPPPGQSGQDAFSALVSSAASIDMDSPVTAKAEFDPPTVPVGGRAIYRIVLNALDESVKVPDQLPAPSGLAFSPGGRGQAYQPTGAGRLQPQTTINFRVTAGNTGTFTVPAFTVTAYGKPVTVPEVQLNVVPAGTAGVREAPRLLLDLPQGDIYVGQTLRIPVMLFDPGDGTVQGMSQTRITGDAIFAEPTSFGQRREVIRHNGQSYPAFIQEVTITPMREGPQTLVAQANGISMRAMSAQPGAFQTASSLIDSDPVVLTVKALPKEGRLPGFAGAIGNFQIEAPKLSTNTVRAGDPLTLTVIVRGDGNLGRLAMPPIPFLREWQSFPPIGDTAPPFAIQQRGFTTFSYTVIPLSDQIKSTPAIPFCSFDPKQGTYVDLTIPPVPITVKPGPPGAAAKLQSSSSRTRDTEADDATNREQELALTGLSEGPGHGTGSLRPLQQRWWFLGLQLVPAAGIGGLLAWDRRRRFLEQHPEVVRKRRARRGLRRQLEVARRAAARQDAAGFVTGAINALREACAPHEAANPEALVCADVLQELSAEDRASRPGEVVRRLFTAADALRFGGPGKDGSELLALRPDFEQLVNQLRARL
ncbi:MAG: hypothetical protein JWR69_1044 [Pedosphaera sp.]|nr:hypothetical protein [Pedosphaera sp.]